MNGKDLEATLTRLRPTQMKDALRRVWAMDPDVFLRALGATLADHGDPLPPVITGICGPGACTCGAHVDAAGVVTRGPAPVGAL